MWLLLNRATPFVFVFGLVLTTVLLLMPTYAVPKEVDLFDKLLHGSIFVILTMTGLIAFPSYARWVVFGLVCYGGLIEVLQSMLTTTRHGDVVDWAADSLGIVVGLGAYLVSQKFVKNAINNIAD